MSDYCSLIVTGSKYLTYFVSAHVCKLFLSRIDHSDNCIYVTTTLERGKSAYQ